MAIPPAYIRILRIMEIARKELAPLLNHHKAKNASAMLGTAIRIIKTETTKEEDKAETAQLSD